MRREAFGEAEERLLEALAMSRRLDDKVRTWQTIGNLGLVALSEERHADAVDLFLSSFAWRTRAGSAAARARRSSAWRRRRPHSGTRRSR